MTLKCYREEFLFLTLSFWKPKYQHPSRHCYPIHAPQISKSQSVFLLCKIEWSFQLKTIIVHMCKTNIFVKLPNIYDPNCIFFFEYVHDYLCVYKQSSFLYLAPNSMHSVVLKLNGEYLLSFLFSSHFYIFILCFQISLGQKLVHNCNMLL